MSPVGISKTMSYHYIMARHSCGTLELKYYEFVVYKKIVNVQQVVT